jgi:hypothetical protein
MNPNNYGTREACQRLVDAGIVLETDFCFDKASVIPDKVREWPKGVDEGHLDFVPAPSMAEVWRELPEVLTIGGLICDPSIGKFECRSYASYNWFHQSQVYFDNTNPTDALIDLLIWLTAQKEGYERTNRRFT